MRVTLPLRALSWASASVNVEHLFTSAEVQELLRRVTEVCRTKVFRARQTKELEAPKYVLMTEKELRKAQAVADDRAKERALAMPPVMSARKPCEELITVDSDLNGHDRSKFVFTDISFGQTERSRLIVLREPDGTLRTANWEERDRILRLYFKNDFREVVAAPVFSSPYFEEALKAQKYSFLLEWACVQFEPDDPEFIRVCTSTYDHVNQHQAWDLLNSTRFYGPMVFYLTLNKSTEVLLADLLLKKKLQQAADLVRLYFVIHDDNEYLSKETYKDDLKVLWNYVKNDAKERHRLEMVLQSLEGFCQSSSL